MANPRKFSEKIAIQRQKQAEETAAFEQIMRDVIKATRKVSGSMNKNQLLDINTNVTGCRAESLPDVNRISASESSSIDLKTALNNLEEIRRGRDPVRRHPSPSAVSRSTQHSPGGHARSSFTDQRRNASSPYSTVYLSPPPMDWRRTNSDSALHQSGLMSLQVNQNSQLQNVSFSPRRSTLHDIENSEVYAISSNEIPNHLASVMPSMAWDPGKDHSNLPNLLSASLPNDSRPKSCEVPGITIHPSPDDNSTIHHLNSFSNTGSLPDLTNLRFPAPLAIPIDLDDPTMSSLSRKPDQPTLINHGPSSPFDSITSPGESPTSYSLCFTSNFDPVNMSHDNPVNTNNGHARANHSSFRPHAALSSTGPYLSHNTVVFSDSSNEENQVKTLKNGCNQINNTCIHSDGDLRNQQQIQQLHTIQHEPSQVDQHQISMSQSCSTSSGNRGMKVQPHPLNGTHSCISPNNHSLNQQAFGTDSEQDNIDSLTSEMESNNNQTQHQDVFSFLSQNDFQDVPHTDSYVPQGSPSHQQISSMGCHRSTTPSDYSGSAPTSPVSSNMSPISSPAGMGNLNKGSCSENSYHYVHQTNVLQRQLEQFKMVPDLRQDSPDNYLLMPKAGGTSSSIGTSSNPYISAPNTLRPSQENLVETNVEELKTDLTGLSSNLIENVSKTQNPSVYMISQQSRVLTQNRSPLIYSSSEISSRSNYFDDKTIRHSSHNPETNMSSQSITLQNPTNIPNIVLTGADEGMSRGQDFCKNELSSMSSMTGSFDANDLFVSEGTIESGLDFDDLRMLSGFSESNPSDAFLEHS